MAFVQNEQVACVIMEDEGGNVHTKEKGAMHFNIRKSCVPWYASVEENDDTLPAEDENGNVRVDMPLEFGCLKNTNQVSCLYSNKGKIEVSATRYQQIQCNRLQNLPH